MKTIVFMKKNFKHYWLNMTFSYDTEEDYNRSYTFTDNIIIVQKSICYLH